MKYKDLLPPLSTEEYAALKVDIETNGQRHPIIKDENGDILDGHHRHKILGDDAVVEVVEGLSDAEKEAFTVKCNFVRRNLSPNQKAEVRLTMKYIAGKLAEDGRSQKDIAAILGVARETVRDWLSEDIPNGGSANRNKPNAKVKVDAEGKRDIVELVWHQGELQDQVAADYAITQGQVSKIVASAKREAAKAESDAKAMKKIAGDVGIHHGDFREIGDMVPDESTALIFTDPPYDKKSLPLYTDLAEFATRVLVDGGSLITYLGQYALDDVMTRMTEGGLKFFWPLCCYHTGQVAQMKFTGIKVHWKPMLWFVKRNRRDKYTFVDDLIKSGQEKDFHPWQQSVVEAKYYIEKLTTEGELVVDPFCGGGTTPLAAKVLGRQWWSCEIDENHVQTARERVDDAECE